MGHGGKSNEGDPQADGQPGEEGEIWADMGEVERFKEEGQTRTPHMKVICHCEGGELKVSWSVGPDSLTVCNNGVSHSCR